MGVEVTVDEADKKQQERRERAKEMRQDGVLPLELINPDPAKHYRKVFYKPGQAQRVARYKARGYQITPADSKTKIPGALRTEDNMQQDGEDLVLMETSQVNYKRRVKEIQRRADRYIEQAREEQTEQVNRIAREAGLIGPHQSVAFARSTEDPDERI